MLISIHLESAPFLPRKHQGLLPFSSSTTADTTAPSKSSIFTTLPLCLLIQSWCMLGHYHILHLLPLTPLSRYLLPHSTCQMITTLRAVFLLLETFSHNSKS